MTAVCPAIHHEIIQSLSNTPAAIAPKYFYDRTGSALFEQITRLPEYYPPRLERALLRRHGGEIAQLLPANGTLIEPGAGNCEKARLLCELIHPRCFVPIDISADFLHAAAAKMASALPGVRVHPVVGDLGGPLALPGDLPAQRRILFFPGSSIGNFEPLPAQHLLRRLRQLLDRDGVLLIGVDLVKQASVLEGAYNDPAGLTAAFNRNVLAHINRLIGSDFRLAQWQHRAFYNAPLARIEMHLEVLCDIDVHWPGGRRTFRQGEAIHTENSYKYTIARCSALLLAAGFRHLTWWSDARQWYALFLARL